VPRSTRSLTLTIGALALAAAACGGGAPQEAIDAQPLACPTDSDCYDPPRAVGEGGQIAFDADEFVFVNMQGLPVEGDLEVTLHNVGAAEHNIFFEGANQGSATADDMLIGPGGEVTGVFNVYAADYVYYCTVPGHRQAGMEGVLTVYATTEEAAAAMPDATEVPTEGETATETETEGGTETEAPTGTETPTESATT
jgi:plastocyanin